MNSGMSPVTEFAMERLHYLLPVMIGLYILRIIRLFRYPASVDRQAPGGRPGTGASKGGGYSLLTIGMPRLLASTKTQKIFYAQFIILHLGLASSIMVSFIFSEDPGFLARPLANFVFRFLIAAGAITGCARMSRRIFNKSVRAISAPEDYFSLGLLIAWMVLCFFTVGEAAAFAEAAGLRAPSPYGSLNEIPIAAFFILTGFFHLYVPFSKIFHYMYYPFARWYLGKTLGYRGVFPLVRGQG